MRGFWFSVLTVAAVGLATPVAAQTPTQPAADARPWYVGLNTGGAVVEKASAVVGAEAGRRVWRRLEIVAEGVWIQNGASKDQRAAMAVLAGYLEQAHGTPASGSMKAPLLYGGVGVRWVFPSAWHIRPYGIFTVGGVHTKKKPSLKLGGSDITNSAAQYGVTLGGDVTGTSNAGAVSGGLGFLLTSGPYFIDVGARMLNLGGTSGRFNAGRLVVGGGYRF